MKNFEEILAEIARENGTTPEDVLHEMQLAIDDAYDHHGKEAQPLVGHDDLQGDRPTPEEFVLQIAMMLENGTGLIH